MSAVVATPWGEAMPACSASGLSNQTSAMPSQASIGLGLAVSRRLARLMGGDLTYRYEDGEAIFELTLPIAVGGTHHMVAASTRAA